LLGSNQNKSKYFAVALPKGLSYLANDMLKNKYDLGFLGVSKALKERELEKRLVEKTKGFILELGKGFTFIGNQYRLEFNENEYFVDLLFFHRNLKSLVVLAS